jgi:hypothetical protein
MSIETFPQDERLTRKQANACTSLQTLLRTTCVFERPCKLCQQVIHFAQTKTGELHPFDADGRTHWSTCPHGEAFRKRNRIKEAKPAKNVQLGLLNPDDYPD